MTRTKHFYGTPRRRSTRKKSDSNQSSVQHRRDSGAIDINSAPESDHENVAENAERARGNGSRDGEAEKPRRGPKRRSRPGKAVLKEIKRLQNTWHRLIPAAPFIRIVRELTFFYSKEVKCWSAEALVAIQEHNASQSHPPMF